MDDIRIEGALYVSRHPALAGFPIFVTTAGVAIALGPPQGATGRARLADLVERHGGDASALRDEVAAEEARRNAPALAEAAPMRADSAPPEMDFPSEEE